MKRLISMLLLFAAVVSASAAVFTDSLGREIELPDTIDGIAPSGNLAQLVLYSVAPEKITGWSSRLSGSAEKVKVSVLFPMDVTADTAVSIAVCFSLSKIPIQFLLSLLPVSCCFYQPYACHRSAEVMPSSENGGQTPVSRS